ncbi:MAG TPA: transposase family protein [Candidatus Anaerobiospirillum pullistercoris]|uniref:Transposase family protein n=1 Tax=Candidatus Anaerobiospirillum pullistercoris TaxID=2838452 RepID=A0A9D2B0X4_9GAMM|nr:transposase family protein [Candidatus Anaerobiospirillum pullistercoris]
MIKSNQPSVEFKGILVRKDTHQANLASSSNTTVGKVPVVLIEAVVQEVIANYMRQMNIVDKRQAGKIKFSAASLLFTVSLAYLCGYRSACSMGKFWEQHSQFLHSVIPSFPDLKVSHDTIKRTIENVVFEKFSLFFTRFTESLIYESFNDLHIRDMLPEDQRWLFNRVLQEHSALERQMHGQENRLHPVDPRVMQDRLYQVVVYGCSTNITADNNEEIMKQKKHLSILKQLRDFDFQGSAVFVTFELES